MFSSPQGDLILATRSQPLKMNPTMFDIHKGVGVRRFAIGLAVLSIIALIVTTWILLDVNREQQIVNRIIEHLPPSDIAVANELSGDLRLRSRLSLLLVLNTIGAAIAFVLVVRGYLSSEQSLRDATVLATDIRASLEGGIITTDRNGRITSLNPRGCELLGIPADGGIGMKPAEVNHEHAMLNAICDEVNTQQTEVRDRDYRIERKQQPRTLRANCTRLKNQRDEFIGTVIHVLDVTERILMEQRLKRMERYMGLGSLAAGLQHEIKNPLSALSLHVQLLGEQLENGGGNPEVTESIGVIKSEVARIGVVLDSFRNYASIKELGRTWIDVATLLETLVRFLRPQTKQQNVTVKVEMPQHLLAPIEADSVQLEQLFLNLALNSLAAMPDGGELRFRLSQVKRSLRVDLADTGHGIPPEIQSQIFDPYFTTRNDGTGMGLALCDKIIRQHGGSIDFVTGTTGTEFSVYLPMKDQA